MSRLWSGLALLASSATLVCCVIPALLVTLGFGAALAGVISAWPQLTLLSEHKVFVFGLAGIILVAAGFMRTRPSAQTCPSDPALAQACQKTRRISGVFLTLSIILYLIALGFVLFFRVQ
jgi:hypothetical protein